MGIANTYDQNGQIINSATTQGQWMERTVDLTPFAGKTMRTVGVVTDAQTGACTWDIYYSDMAIVSTDGTVTPIYDRESAVSLQYYSSAGITNAVAAAERSNTADDAIQPANSTTYYVGDQIGSERMLLAAGGWPLSSDSYYPYGVEATPSAGANHYKFTGKERDYASGNDYFGARYYSSNMGRFMSPDWSAKAEPVPYAKLDNPQSLNLYSYVYNNPITGIDLDGHLNCSDPASASGIGCQTQAAWQAMANGLSTSVADYMQRFRNWRQNQKAQLSNAANGPLQIQEDIVYPIGDFGALGEAEGVLADGSTLKVPAYAKTAGGFVNWLKGLAAKGTKLTAEDADGIIAKADGLGVKVRLDPPHPGTNWDVPHLNIGSEGQVHLEVPSGYSNPNVTLGSTTKP